MDGDIGTKVYRVGVGVAVILLIPAVVIMGNRQIDSDIMAAAHHAELKGIVKANAQQIESLIDLINHHQDQPYHLGEGEIFLQKEDYRDQVKDFKKQLNRIESKL